MRPIKFRVKGRDNQWHYGYPLIYNDESFSFVDYEKLNDYKTPLELCTLEYVEDDTLGEFTRLHDKNGREIYEGDVVKFIDYDSYDEGFENAGVVKYGGNMFYITNRYSVNMEDLVDDLECSMYCEVIGNVYDSPKLLKGEDV